MKKKTIIAFFCATFSVCAIYGGLRYTVSSSTGQITMADTLEEENSMGNIVSPCLSKDHISISHNKESCMIRYYESQENTIPEHLTEQDFPQTVRSLIRQTNMSVKHKQKAAHF